MKWNNILLKLKLIAIISMALFMTSCVPEVGQKSARCDSGHSFNSTTQKCENFEFAPSQTLQVYNMTEDQADATVVLTYHDSNGDLASSCKVIETESDLSLESPIVTSTKAEAIFLINTVSGATMSGGYPATATVNALIASAGLAYIDATDNDDFPTVSANLRSIATSMQQAINLLALDITSPSSVTTSQNAQVIYNSFDIHTSFVENKCYCTGGVCSSLIKLNKNINGTYGFQYSVDDNKSGATTLQTVQIEIAAFNDQPVASPKHEVLTESAPGAIQTSYTLTMPTATDIELGGPFSTWTYVPQSAITAYGGTIVCSSIINTCTYTPTSNDVNTTTEGRAGTYANNTYPNFLELTAIAKGVDGNQISLEILSQQLTNSGANVEVTVSGTDIIIYVESGVTTCAQVKTALDADIYVSSLVTVNCTAAGVVNIGARAYLAGGTDSFDYFNYYATGDGSVPIMFARYSLDMTALDDRPANGTGTLPTAIIEDTATEITLDYSDIESDLATACTITSAANIEIVSTTSPSCLCTAGVCKVWVQALTDSTATATFDYTVTANGLTSTATTHSMSVTSANDLPAIGTASFTIVESTTAIADPAPIDLTSVAAYDPEDGPSLIYTLVTGSEVNGTVSGCFGGTSDIDCIFTPVDGNISGSTGAIATGTLGSLNFTAKSFGTWANGVSVSITNTGTDLTSDPIVSVAYTTTTAAINVLGNTGTTYTQIQAALVADPRVNLLITSAGAGGVAPTSGPLLLTGGLDSIASFKYKVTDPSGDNVFVTTVNIDITSAPDNPVICAYSKFEKAPECGLNGCTDSNDPTSALIVPATDGLLFYDENSSVCYISANGAWSIASEGDFIPDQFVNQLAPIVIDSIKVDEGDGVGNTEISETLTIQGLTSDNGTLIPTGNILAYYNGVLLTGLTGTSTVIDNGGLSEDGKDFKIIITPLSGLSGDATISFSLVDSAGGTSNISFNVEVFGNSALHGGWKNIQALGPKTTKFDLLPDEDQVCTFSETKCNNGSSCSGTTVPSSSFTPDQIGAFYYNTTDKSCYYSTGITTADWTKISTESYCAVSPSDYETACAGLGASCIGMAAPIIVPTQLDSLYFDVTNNKCYRSIGLAATTDWIEYKGPASVTLEWENFTILGTGFITGYNVYRRLSGDSFDYSLAINKTELASSASSYVDNHTNSRFGPTPGTVYYYQVAPIIQATKADLTTVNVITPTSESFATVRVISPPENRAFVHRWIVNKTMCEKMHSTTIDTTNNYRCEYGGPGDTLISGTRYYDFGRDLLVDRFEVGCRYTVPTDGFSCVGAAADGSCIGQGSPVGLISGPGSGVVYYDRSSGQCWDSAGGTAWDEVDGNFNIIKKYNVAELPPLVNIPQNEARDFCANSVVEAPQVLGQCSYNSSGVGAPGGAGAAGSYYYDTTNKDCYIGDGVGWIQVYSSKLQPELPTRKDQVAYGDWDFESNADSAVTNLEEGLALNSSAKCNSSSASGLTAFYTDTDTPDVNSLFTLPGTASSGIKSIMTGSPQSNLCVSKYGIQDTVGNVSEWTVDRMTCTDANNCVGLANGDAFAVTGFSDMKPDTSTAGEMDAWRIGYYNVAATSSMQIGPCSSPDTTTLGSYFCASPITTMNLGSVSDNSNRIAIPMGLPIASSYNSADVNTDPIGQFMLLFNNSSGLTTTQGHNDVFTYNTASVFADGDSTGGLTTGGSYLDGTGAGTYAHEMVPINGAARVDIGFRCIAPVSSYLE